MRLDDQFALLLENVHSELNDNKLAYQAIIPLIDLTLLDARATSLDINALAEKAKQYQVASICVYPEHLNYLPPTLAIKRATVVNFPTGDQPLHQVLKTVEDLANHHKTDEIDYVFPYQAYLAGKQIEALADCHEVYQLCKKHGLIFKVILETGALPSMDVIYQLSVDVIKSGCDFLKTSTGKIAVGASLAAAFAILSAIKETQSPCGIKLSGGIKTLEQALPFMRLAEQMLGKKVDNSWFRFGASSLLEDVLLNLKTHAGR